MKLAPHHEVVAVDINPVQLAYAERRFDGDPGFRGRAERIMDFMRFFGPVAGWWPSRVRAFLELDDPSTNGVLATGAQYLALSRRPRCALFRDGASLGLRALASSISCRNDSEPSCAGAWSAASNGTPIARTSTRVPCYWASCPPSPLPRRRRTFGSYTRTPRSFSRTKPPASFDGFTLSNILDGVDDAYRQRLLAAVKRAAAPGAATVLRSFGDTSAKSPANRAADDRAMLWGSVLVRPAAEL